MSADIYTKGFDDAGLFQRLLLFTNLYAPEQWTANILRPPALLGDKTSAEGHPGFDESLINSQWSIYLIWGCPRAGHKKGDQEETA